MSRTVIELDDEVAAALERISNTRRQPQDEIIREALRAYVTATEAEGLPRKIPGAGAYRSGRSDLSANAKRLAREGLDRKRGW